MKAIMIAAGMGTRLRPMTNDLPKCMAVNIYGRTLFDMQVETLKNAGLTDIVVVRGYQGDKFTRPDVRYIWNHDFQKNNILGSLMCASAEFTEDLLILYSDIWFEKEVVEQILKSPADMIVIVDRQWKQHYAGRSDHPVTEAEAVEADASGKVLRIGKIAGGDGKLDGEFIGMMKLSRAGARVFCEQYGQAEKRHKGGPFVRAASFEKAYVTDMLQALSDAGFSVQCSWIEGGWREIDTLQDFRSLLNKLSEGQRF